MFLESLLGFLFGVAEPKDNVLLGLVFATTCAFGFVVFVIIDFLRFMIRRLDVARGRGLGLHIDHGGKTVVYLLLGACAAWLVGLMAYITNLFQPAPVSAIAVGVTWEFVFEQLIGRAQGQEPEARPVDDDETDQQQESKE